MSSSPHRDSQPRSAKPSNSPSPRPEPAGWGVPPGAVLAVFVLLLALYWLLYFSADLHGGVKGPDGALQKAPKRFELLVMLLLPDVMVKSWLGAGGPALLDRLPALSVAAVWLAAAAGAGALLLDALGLRATLSRWEHSVLALAGGLALLSTLTLAVGLAGALRTAWAPVAVAVILAAAAWRWWSVWRREPARPALQRREASDRWTAVGLGCAAPFVVLLALTALMPPWEFDVREYHLQVPKEWHQQGRITFLPHNVYGNMPLGAEMHPLAAMCLMPGADGWWQGALAGKLLMASVAPLAAAGLLAAGRRWFSNFAGVAAALVCLSTPWVFKVSAVGHNEMVMGCYFLLSLYAAARWMEALASGEAPRGWLILAGLLTGAAVACKYTAVVFLAGPLLLAVLAVAWRRLGAAGAGRAAVVLVLAAVASGGLWYAKNLALTGNPIYPLGYRWLGGRSWDEEKDRRWTQAHAPHGHSLKQLTSSAARIGWQSPEQSPILLPLAALGLLDRRRRWLLALLGGWLLYAAAAWWLLTHRLDRFLVPAAPVAALLAGAGADLFPTALWRRTMAGVIGLSLVATLLIAASGLLGDSRILVPLDKLRRDESLQRSHPAHLYLNHIVPPGKRALLVGEAQVFDLEVDILYNTCFDDCIFEQLVRGRTAAQRRQALRDAHVSHIFVHWQEVQRYREPGNYGFTDYVTPEVFQELVDQGVLKRVPVPAGPDTFDRSGELFEVQ